MWALLRYLLPNITASDTLHGTSRKLKVARPSDWSAATQDFPLLSLQLNWDYSLYMILYYAYQGLI